jgi:hypothetical protein
LCIDSILRFLNIELIYEQAPGRHKKRTDIRNIKDILGHFDIPTTERYLHVSKKDLVNIASPLDDLWRKGKVEY